MIELEATTTVAREQRPLRPSTFSTARGGLWQHWGCLAEAQCIGLSAEHPPPERSGSVNIHIRLACSLAARCKVRALGYTPTECKPDGSMPLPQLVVASAVPLSAA
jgi:hypothetical protein